MLNRRTFLRGTLLAPFLARQGDSATCSNSYDVSNFRNKTLPNFRPPQPRDILPFTCGGAPGSARRPLWSELVAEKKMDAYGKTLQKAYGEMASRPPSDPCSLMYQGWLHWFRCPLDKSREDIHCSSGFLPWHRAYLYFYERLIQNLANEPEFRIAAWDWEKPGNIAIPPIYDSQGFFPPMGCEYTRAGQPFSIQNVVAYLQYNGTPLASHWFLGGERFPGYAAFGPHSDVHEGVGLLMGYVDVAAFDPVFFAHHANIDRLWDFWYQRYNSVPGFFKDQTWPVSKDPWVFYDAKIDRYVAVEPKQMFHMEPLGYHYTRPNISLYDYTTLQGTPTENQVAFRASDVEKFFRKMEDALRKTIGMIPAGVTSLMRLSMADIEAAAHNFTLPVVARFSGPEHAMPGSYDVLFNNVRLGGFSILQGSHSMGPVVAFLSLAYKDLAILRAAITKPAAIRCEPFLHLHLDSFEVHYPACTEAWKDLLSPPADPQAYHNCGS